MQQCVRQPTRGQYLLDLVLSDLPRTKVEVSGVLADHNAVLASIPMQISELNVQRRRGWNFAKANWPALKRALRDIDWSFVHTDALDQATEKFSLKLLIAAQQYIPLRVFTENKSQHPWLNTRCREAIDAKHAAEGTEFFEQFRDVCSATINEEYLKNI